MVIHDKWTAINKQDELLQIISDSHELLREIFDKAEELFYKMIPMGDYPTARLYIRKDWEGINEIAKNLATH